jgi:cation diffusion facilitator CzcD-associated flavoprotein CzcO
MTDVVATNETILVVGGGISGMTVAYGGNAKEAGLDGNIIRATKLEEVAAGK